MVSIDTVLKVIYSLNRSDVRNHEFNLGIIASTEKPNEAAIVEMHVAVCSRIECGHKTKSLAWKSRTSAWERQLFFAQEQSRGVLGNVNELSTECKYAFQGEGRKAVCVAGLVW